MDLPSFLRAPNSPHMDFTYLHTPATSTPIHPLFTPTKFKPADQDVPLQLDDLLDNSPLGPDLVPCKPDNTTRIFTQNPNGFALTDEKGGGLNYALEWLALYETDVLGFSAHDLATSRYHVREKIRTAFYSHYQHRYRLHYGSDPIKPTSNRHQGGCLAATVGSTLSRLVDKGSDYLGRWSWLRFVRSDGRFITYVVAYQCFDYKSPEKAEQFPNSVYYKQHSVLVKERRKNPDPRKHFVADLEKFLSECRERDDLLIVTGDFNDEYCENTSPFGKILTKAGLVDAYVAKNGVPLEKFRTCAKQTVVYKCIDYMFISKDLLPALKACGYEPFNKRIPSDHRGMWMDFDTTKLFGKSLIDLPSFSGRDLHSTCPQQITSYWQAKMKYLQNQHFEDAANAFLKHPTVRRAQRLDNMLIRACNYAGKRCKKIPPFPYSPELLHARNVFNLLRLYLHQHQTGISHAPGIELLRKRVGDDFPVPASWAQCVLEYKTAKKKLREMEKAELTTKQLRYAHLEARAEVLAYQGHRTKAQHLEQLIKGEQTRDTYAYLGHVMNKNKDGGLSHLEVPANQQEDPKQCKEWLRVECPQEIEAFIMERNQKHFGQMEGTPPTLPPLRYQVDFSASTMHCELMLDGEYDTSALDYITNLMIQHTTRVTDLDGLPMEITPEEFEGKIKAWKESTTTSPSGMHLGHYKAYFAPLHLPPEDPLKDTLENHRSFVLKTHLALINFALKEGYSYDRWKVIVSCMLEKDPGEPKIHRLRVIHIYEADYNLLLGLHWRRLTKSSVENGLLNQGLYGSMPGKDAHTPVYMDTLQYEISFARGEPLIKNDYDATSCYDRMHCFLANIVSRKYGLHRNVCIVQGKTLEEAKYYLKTKMGVSKTFVEHCEFRPWYGTGQGAGNSPTYWLVISSTLFDIYDKMAHGATFATPDGTIEIQMYMVAFVDDSNNAVNDWHSEDTPMAQDLLQMALEDTQLWHDLLWSSGGALELPKCSYHFLQYQYNDKCEQTFVPGTTSTPLAIQDPSGKTISCKPLCAYKAHKTLGCHKAPANQLKQQEVLTTKCNAFAHKVNTNFLTTTQANIMHNSMYIPSVSFPLSKCYFTEKTLQAIQAKSLPAFVTKCGYHSHMPRAVLHGPSLYSGSQLHHLYDEQGTGQIYQIMKHWRSPGQAGPLTKIAIAWWQHYLGIGFSFLEDVSTRIPHFPDRYFQVVRQYLQDSNCYLTLENTFVPPLQRQKDQYIMDYALNRWKKGLLSLTDLNIINTWRMHLQLVSVSDVTDASGAYLDTHLFKGQQTPNSRSRLSPFRHPRPPQHTLSIWQTLLKSLLKYGPSNDPNRRLKKPLGAWLHAPSQMRRQWRYYYSPKKDMLYTSSIRGYSAHGKLAHRIYKKQPVFGPILRKLPKDATPANAWDDTTLTLRPGYNSIPTTQVPSQPETFDEYLQTLPTWEKQLLSQVTVLTNRDLAIALLEPLVAASDGSAPFAASFGWIISSTNGDRLLKANGPAPGCRPTSFRAEAYGGLSLWRYLYHFFKYHQLSPHSSIEHHIDNKAFLKRFANYRSYPFYYPNETMKPDWDVLQSCASTWKTLTDSYDLQISFHHVKSHQDKHKDYDKLSLPAQLNIDADHMAEAFLLDNPESIPTAPLIQGAGLHIHCPEGTITTRHKRKIIDARTGPILRKHMQDKHAWNDQVFEDINWEAHRTAFNRKKHHNQATLVKLIHGWLPIGQRIKHYSPKYSMECSLCGEVETQQHIHQCSERHHWKQAFLEEISQYCTKLHTKGAIKAILIELLASVMDQRPINPKNYCDFHGSNTLIDHQNQIGYQQLFLGRFSLKWDHYQNIYWKKQKNLPSNCTNWTAQIITFIYTKWFELWTIRNSQRHGEDQEAQRAAHDDQVVREVYDLYSQQDQIPTEDRWIFKLPIEDQLLKTPQQLRTWLYTWQPVIDARLKEQAEQDKETAATELDDSSSDHSTQSSSQSTTIVLDPQFIEQLSSSPPPQVVEISSSSSSSGSESTTSLS